MVLNLSETKEKHQIFLHIIEDYSELDNLHDLPSYYFSEFEFDKCDKCGIIMEFSTESKILYYEMVHLRSNYLVEENEILYCNFGQSNSRDLDQFHHSLISKLSEL